MPAYVVKLPHKSGRTLPEGVNAMVVFADSAAQAIEMASARYDGDGQGWSLDATATEVTAGTDWNGWTFKVAVLRDPNPIVVEKVADATDNTIDEIGAALATLLNAHADIANASYDGVSNTLTIAGAADNLGDQKVAVEITPPGGFSAVPSLVGAITDEGLAGAALSVVLPADAAVVPIVREVLQQA